jgi:ElaB/YqjD/DUF883 family membrane-anchored ribosome-binding protein
VQPISEAVTETIKPVADAAGELTDNVVQPVTETVTGTIKPVTEVTGELTDKVVQPVAEAVTETIKPVADAAGELTDKVAQPVAEAVTETIKPVADATVDLTDKVVQPVAEAVTETINPIAAGAAAEPSEKNAQPIAEKVMDLLKPVADAAEELTDNVVQPVAEVVMKPLKAVAEEVGVQPVLDLVISPVESVSADKSPTLKVAPSGIAPSIASLLPVEHRLETAGDSYTAAIQSIPKPTPSLSKVKGHQSAIADSSNTFMPAKTSQFPEREKLPILPLSEPMLPPSASAVGSLLPLTASVKNGKAELSCAGNDCKAVLIVKADAMLQCSGMLWHCRIRHYLSWSHAPPLRPPVAPDSR